MRDENVLFRHGNDAGEQVVHGLVRGAAADRSGAAIIVVDKDMRHEQVLGRASLAPDGTYEIFYKRSQFRRAEKKSADLVVRVVDCDGKVLAESAVMFNAPANAQIDLTISANPTNQRPEYETIIATIAPVLEGVAISHLTSDDLDFLAGECSLDRDELGLLAAAAQIGKGHHLDAELLYGWFREGMASDIDGLLATSPDDLRDALTAAISDNIVNSKLVGSIDGAVAQIKTLAISAALAPDPDPTVTSIGALLEAGGVAADAQKTLVDLYLTQSGSIEDFWTAVAARTDLPQGTLEAAQTAAWVGALAEGYLPLVNALLGKDKVIAAPQDLARFTQPELVALLKAKAVAPPSDTEGDTDDAKLDNYATALTQSIAGAFPTAVLVDRMKRVGRQSDQALLAFFADNPDLDLTQPIDTYFQANPGKAPAPAVDAQVRSYSRLMKLEPEFAKIDPLVQAGLGSATKIVKLGAQAFTAQYADTFGGADQAAAVFGKAQQVVAATVAIFARYSPLVNSVGTRVTTTFS